MQLNEAGYFTDAAGDCFLPVGANYWPASCGVEMWNAWPEAEIFADLDLMASLGFNTVRFFVRWPDFEPQPGVLDTTALARLRRFLDACVERGLHPQPSLFVGWMSGGFFWPTWKQGRSLFTDSFMIERAEAFARQLAVHLRPFAGQLCGIDLGNELNALPESREAAPSRIREWCRRMTDAVRSELPEAVILSGCDHQQVIADTGWRLGDQPGIDVLTMHGYPVPGWHPVRCGGLQDDLTQSLLPFYVKCARAFGPVMLQEFGTILSGHAGYADRYLRAVLPACRRAGANGFLWWCFRDIPARVHPYVKSGFESTLGLLDADGRVKPGLEYFVEFAREAARAPEPAAEPKADVHLYWPKHYYLRDNPLNPGNEPREVARRMILAHHGLERAGKGVGIVRGGDTLSDKIGTVVIAGCFPDLDEVEALLYWVEQGGRLLWHGPDPAGWGEAMSRLVGAEIADYHAPRPLEVVWAGHRHRLESYPRGIRLEVMCRGAEVLLADDAGHPLVLRHKLGQGCVTSVLADVEGSFLAQGETHLETEKVVAGYVSFLSEPGGAAGF